MTDVRAALIKAMAKAAYESGSDFGDPDWEDLDPTIKEILWIDPQIAALDALRAALPGLRLQIGPPTFEWKLVPPEGTPTGEPFLFWRKDWEDEDANPTGVQDGWFQEGGPGEAYFGVASFCLGQDCYTTLELTDPAEWPTHYIDKPVGPDQAAAPDVLSVDAVAS